MPKKKGKRRDGESMGVVTMDTKVKGLDGKSSSTLVIGMLVQVGRSLGDRELLVEASGDIWRIKREVIVSVQPHEWPYLAAIPSPVERVFFLNNPSILDRLIHLDRGSFVNVQLEPGIPLPAILKYKGPVPAKGPGHYFGLELLDGEGETDGSYGGVEYFRCPAGTGLFVPLSQVRHTAMTLPSSKPPTNGNIEGGGRRGGRLKVGDAVVWIGDDGQKRGLVCKCSSSPTSDVTVLFDEEVRLHPSTEYDRTHILPTSQLIKLSDFLGISPDESDEKSFEKSKELRSSKSIDIINRRIRPEADLILFDTPPTPTPLQDGLSHGGRDEDDWLESQDGEFGVGSLVKVQIKGSAQFGVIRWIGNIKGTLSAGIELENEVLGLGDGMEQGKRYFYCHPDRGVFVPLSGCRPDDRFLDLPSLSTSTASISAATGGATSIYANTSSGESAVIGGSVAPLSREEDLGDLCGKYRGIQGHHNSCYLDATLFSMFTFTSVFDNLLLRPADSGDIAEYGEVQRVLREEIVNPLRANLYVSSDRVMKLRTLLDRLSNVPGLTSEEKDPEEFLTSLVAQILRAEPFLKLSSGQDAYLYQLFLEKDESISFPSVQQLFDHSFLASHIKLKQVPSCLIIQMPRFGKSYKMYPRILPSQVLDITDVIQDSPRQCTVCGKLAEFECKQCFNQCDAGLQSISFCSSCIHTAHSHEKRANHRERERLSVPHEFVDLSAHCSHIPRIYMSLFAVLCIETSHYVAFVKCGTGPEAPWCFFDSMADRKGEQDGYNIPEVVACPYLPEWLSERGSHALSQISDEKQLPELAKRLLCDAYMCIYQSTDIMMYS